MHPVEGRFRDATQITRYPSHMAPPASGKPTGRQTHSERSANQRRAPPPGQAPRRGPGDPPLSGGHQIL